MRYCLVFAIWFLAAVPARTESATEMRFCQDSESRTAIVSCAQPAKSGRFNLNQTSEVKRAAGANTLSAAANYRKGEFYRKRLLKRSHRAKYISETAIRHYKAAIKLRPKFVDAHLGLGEAYFYLAKEYGDASSIGGPNRRRHEQLWREYNQLGSRHLDTAARLAPNSAPVFYRRGQVYQRWRKFHRAISEYTKTIRKDPKHVRAHYLRGYVRFWFKGQWRPKGLADFRTVSRLAPNNAGLHNSMAWQLYKGGMAHEALPYANRSIQVNPKSPNALDTRARINQALRRRHAAINDYKAAARVAGRNYKLLNEMAWQMYKGGMYREALPIASQSLNVFSKNPMALDTRAHIYEKLGRKREAIKDFRAALPLRPIDHETYKSVKAGLRRLGVMP